jgi:hypothetical protein
MPWSFWPWQCIEAHEVSRKSFGERGGDFNPRMGRSIAIEHDQQVPVAHEPSLLPAKRSQSISQQQRV